MDIIRFRQDDTELQFRVEGDRVTWQEDERDFDGGVLEALRRQRVLCEAEITGRGTGQHTGDRHIFCSESDRFRYARHDIAYRDGYALCRVEQRSDVAKLTSFFMIYAGTNTIRCWNEIENVSRRPFSLEYISSYCRYGCFGRNRYDRTEFYLPGNGWYCECQWRKSTLADSGVFSGNGVKSMKKLAVTNTGSWSTKSFLPMGILRDADTGRTLLWQIEANGSWTYELGDLYDSVTLNLSGPTFQENGWRKTLNPGERFETVKAAVTEADGLDAAFRNMTGYRRSIVRKSRDLTELPVIFNEYMYASWNTPSAASAEELAPVAADLGADCYVIDCGWHDEQEDPFYYVGKWEESKARYPEGLWKTAERVKGLGLSFGLWMEPEVVGARGDAANDWTEDCFFSRAGSVLKISDRYQLDFRNPKVTERLDRKVDELIEKYGVSYLKLDYNIEAGVGTDVRADSPGDGLLEHGRAYIRWLRGITRRHPDLAVENCASGGNRMDYLTLSACDIQSTSDQTDYAVYPYIVANMLSAVLPEQAAVWAYPYSTRMPPERIDEECVAMNMVNALPGRMHLASRMQLLSERCRALVAEGVRYYKELSAFKRSAAPFFPKGFARYGDSQLAFGLRGGDRAVLFVYGMRGSRPITVELDRAIAGVRVAYPRDMPLETEVDGRRLTVRVTRELQARALELLFVPEENAKMQ